MRSPSGMTCSHFSGFLFFMTPSRVMPALLMQQCNPPWALTASCTAFSQAEKSATSTTIAVAVPPSSLIALAVASTASATTSATTTVAPSFAKRIAVALPMPLPAPVMIATLSFKPMVSVLSRVAGGREAPS